MVKRGSIRAAVGQQTAENGLALTTGKRLAKEPKHRMDRDRRRFVPPQCLGDHPTRPPPFQPCAQLYARALPAYPRVAARVACVDSLSPAPADPPGRACKHRRSKDVLARLRGGAFTTT